MDFQTSANKIKEEGKACGLTNDELLALYGLYKQATVGDNNTEKPSFYQLENKAKWEAWNNRKGLSQKQAEAEYIALVAQFLLRKK